MLRPDVLRSEKAFLRRCDKGKWKRVVHPRSRKLHAERREIARYLNHFEVVCVAIRQNVVDEDVLKAVIGDKLVRRYAAARPLIQEIRTDQGDDELLEHFEYVARKWRDYPKTSSRNLLRTIFSQVSRP